MAQTYLTFPFTFFFGGGGYTCSMEKFLGQGSNLHHSHDPSHNNDDIGS